MRLVRGYYGDLPLWLDEGLAEYFETHPDAIDARDEHLTKLPLDLKQGWVPDLARLEGLTDIHQMSPRDYRESWAWVHLMLARDGPGKSLLLDYLGDLRKTPQRQALSQVLAARGISPKNLVSHLEKLQASVLARNPEPPSGDRLIRFQDHPTDPAVVRASTTPRGSAQTHRLVAGVLSTGSRGRSEGLLPAVVTSCAAIAGSCILRKDR